MNLVWRYRLALFALGSLSIGSLLLYFFGVGSFFNLFMLMLPLEAAGLAAAYWWAARRNLEAERHVLVSGLLAGCLATLAYDLVRIPVAHSGVPVFKAISYFGTVLLGVDAPTPASEVLGWAYHLSNGVSFGLMYAALVRRPGPITSILWGLSLEAAMLLTPYAEVFGYQRNARFMAITIGSHAVFGFVLYLGLRTYGNVRLPLRPALAAVTLIMVPLGLWATAVDFDGMYRAKIPHSPPPYLGPKLYTAWNVPEPDRVVALWIMRRYVEPAAQFQFIEPFDKVKLGKPFDMPEADIRRHGMSSASEYLLENGKVPRDAKLNLLAHMTNLTEVSPWMLASDAEAGRLAEYVRSAAERSCGKALKPACLPALMGEIDHWYNGTP